MRVIDTPRLLACSMAGEIAARVRREVLNKLETGPKNPK